MCNSIAYGMTYDVPVLSFDERRDNNGRGRKKWEADAGNISNYMNFDRFVYRNGAVNSFLNDAGKFFIIAAKGMGKTLLLSYKRYLLWQKYSVNGDNTSVIFIPSQNPYVSFIENIGTTLSQEHINKFEDWEYCQKVWATVIELSVLSYAEIDVELFLGSLPPRASRHIGWLKSILSEPRTVDFVFNELISMSESSITQFIRDMSNAVNFAFRNVNRAVFMFFDRFDNALEVAHDSIWQPIQAGLLEAAWNVMRSNSHIKMYLSIRQEAYAAHHSRNSYAISSSVVKIEYSREELKQLVNQLVQYYENRDTLEAFLGFDYFHNTIVFADEKVYDFMFRYSIGRPRDFVVLCDELSKASDTLYANDEEKRQKLKERVRDIASNAIIQSLFDELRMLLCCLTTLVRFNNFLTLLKCNILSYSEMKTICCKYNEGQCQGDCSICSNEHHPFCDLYNMGLIGIVSSDTGSRFQQFKTPYANLIHGLRDDNDYFLIHPALREYINNLHKSTRRGRNYTLYKGILIGNGLPWIDEYDDLYRVNGRISQIKNDETRHFFEATLEESIKFKDWKLNVEKYNVVRANSYPIYEQRIIDAIVTYLETKKFVSPSQFRFS